MAEHDAQTGALLREYVWLDTMPLAMVTGPAATPSYTWITTGNLNEPLLLTNAAGAITASTTRDPWGNPILLAGGAPLDLGYPGQWRDASTGLFQNWHRDYDPTLGRYAQADPLGLGGGSNVFAYVGGDPVNVTDPTGKIPLIPIAAAILTGGIIGGLIDIDFQLLANGGKIRCIDWESVGWSAGIGGLTNGVGSVAVPWFFKAGGKIPRIWPTRPHSLPIAKPPTASPKVPSHHICTNKNCISPLFGGPWTPRLKPLFDKAGMNMDDALNKVSVPGHYGPHPEAYHREVYRRLSQSTQGLKGGPFTRAFQTELGAMNQELRTPGSILHSLLMGL